MQSFSMNIEIRTSKDFDKDFKRLSKRYRSLKDDLRKFLRGLRDNTEHGDEVIEGIYKYRMAITSKNKGKSGGARVISSEMLISIDEKSVVLLTIYDKSDTSNITDAEIIALKKRAGL